MTEKQVLTQLRLRKLKLTLELERVEIAIKAFEDIDVTSLNEFDLLAYRSDMTNEDKILWALGKLKEATAMEISDYLIHMDATLTNRTRVINAITYSASRMFNTKKIEAKKVGTKNFYRLK